MRKQEVFDKVARHLIFQDKKSDDGGIGQCLYRGPNGLKCAAGILIEDDEYTQDMEGSSICKVDYAFKKVFSKKKINLNFLQQLQSVHDLNDPPLWPEKLRQVAAKHHLSRKNLNFFIRQKKWYDALLSDKYKQITGFLAKVDQGFCCLGVACEVAIENGLEVDKHTTGCYFEYDDELKSLPVSVRDWFGLVGAVGNLTTRVTRPRPEISINTTNDFLNLSDMNDAGYDFASIAKQIKDGNVTMKESVK